MAGEMLGRVGDQGRGGHETAGTPGTGTIAHPHRRRATAAGSGTGTTDLLLATPAAVRVNYT